MLKKIFYMWEALFFFWNFRLAKINSREISWLSRFAKINSRENYFFFPEKNLAKINSLKVAHLGTIFQLD